MWLEALTSEILNRMLTRKRRIPTAGLPLGSEVDPPHKKVVFPDRHRCEHMVIVGKTGSGKTHLLELLATEMARRSEGFCFFDFHGDASLSLISRLLKLPDARDRLVVLDPSHQ